MNDIEKAIVTLKDMKGYFNYRSHRQYSMPAIDLAVSALEKQLPKEPIEKQFNLKGDLIGLCPVCKEMWCIKYKEYCANCGQKLDWEVE